MSVAIGEHVGLRQKPKIVWMGDIVIYVEDEVNSLVRDAVRIE